MSKPKASSSFTLAPSNLKCALVIPYATVCIGGLPMQSSASQGPLWVLSSFSFFLSLSLLLHSLLLAQALAIAVKENSIPF